MSGTEEHADGVRLGTYPARWGRPEGEQYSERRTDWVRAKVVERWEADVIAAWNLDVLTAHRRLAARDGQLLAILRAAELNRRKYGPR
jgi:hypothetical protein